MDASALQLIILPAGLIAVLFAVYLARDVLSQCGQELAPEQRTDHADRQQVAVADGFPAFGGGAASSDQDMGMGMEAQRSPPGARFGPK